MDERLEKLVSQAQQHERYSQERQTAVSQLVEQCLRSRPICRPLGSQPLVDVQQEIYEQVRQQLEETFSQELDSYSRQTTVRDWTNALRNQTFCQILEDRALKKLALAAQRYPPNTQLRRHLLGELVEAIQLSGRLCRPHREKFAPSFYELLYEEAVIETLTYVCKNIDKYDPQRGKDHKFITWVNFRLDKCVIECRRRFSKVDTFTLPSLADLEKIQPQETAPSLAEMMRECIEEDADQTFKQAQIRNRPDANFRAIALARFSGRSWEDISSELGIVVPTLSSFFQRCCHKFAPKFRNYLQS